MKPHVHHWYSEGFPFRRCDCGRWGVWDGIGKPNTDSFGVRAYSAGGVKERRLEARYQRAKETR